MYNTLVKSVWRGAYGTPQTWELQVREDGGRFRAVQQHPYNGRITTYLDRGAGRALLRAYRKTVVQYAREKHDGPQLVYPGHQGCVKGVWVRVGRRWR